MKKYSWNERVFLRVHSYAGTNAFRDTAMLFCAHGLIYALAFFVAGFLFATRPLPAFWSACVFGAVVSIFAYAGSFAIGFVLRKDRPYRVFPASRPLFETVDGWKTFPSDHTLGASIAACVAVLFGAPVWLGMLLCMLALGVGFSRVYAGVHFPADVVAGFVLGALTVYALVVALERMGLFLYDGGYLLFV
jgi:undecaprenyl-diphosphatase